MPKFGALYPFIHGYGSKEGENEICLSAPTDHRSNTMCDDFVDGAEGVQRESE